MAASMTEREFSRHLNTKFRVKIQASSPVELELVEVIGYPGNRGDQDGLERFSVYFIGVGETTLPQSTCTLQHERMGEFDIFIVPIAGNERGFRLRGCLQLLQIRLSTDYADFADQEKEGREPGLKLKCQS